MFALNRDSCYPVFQVTFPNGWTVSIGIGSGHYCSNRNRREAYWAKMINSQDAEIAVWKNNGKISIIETPKNATELLAILNEFAAKIS